MKIKLLTPMACPEAHGRLGEVIQVSESLGKSLVSGGYAVEIQDAPPAVTVEPTPEKEEAKASTKGKEKRAAE
jgi:hypothetical protein